MTSDFDGDGFGRKDGGKPAAEQPEGYVTNRFDCDDENPRVNPDAEEVLDSVFINRDGLKTPRVPFLLRCLSSSCFFLMVHRL